MIRVSAPGGCLCTCRREQVSVWLQNLHRITSCCGIRFVDFFRTCLCTVLVDVQNKHLHTWWWWLVTVCAFVVSVVNHFVYVFLLGVTLYLRTSLGEERAHLETDTIGAASDSRALTFQRKNRRHFDPKNSEHRWPSSLLFIHWLLSPGCA